MNIIEKTYKQNGTLKIRSKTKRAILHHAAAKTCTPEQVDSWHKARGWTCIGYHFFVRKDGTIYRGRPENTIGAHATNNNSDSIGICAEGNFEIEKMPEVQKQAIIWLIHSYLKPKYGELKILRHKDVGSTACPGKNYPFDEIVSQKTIAENTTVSSTSANYTVKIKSNDGFLNVREKPDANSKIITTVKNGEVYTIVAESGKWGKLKSGVGYIHLGYTEKYNSNTVEYYPRCGQGFVSLVNALNSIKVNSSFENRKRIAQKNNVKDYTGTAQQNSQLLSKLKSGRLIK